MSTKFCSKTSRHNNRMAIKRHASIAGASGEILLGVVIITNSLMKTFTLSEHSNIFFSLLGMKHIFLPFSSYLGVS